jgi:predicted acetyltransferase
MIELHTGPKHAVPREIAVQIRSFIRVQWPFLNGLGNRIWDYRLCANEPTTFALIDDEILVSHVEVNFRVVEFAGETLRVGGLSAVFTYPAFRGAGFSKQIVTAATDFLHKSEVDLSMLFCAENLERFYTACGWTAKKSARVMYGDRAKPKLKDDNLAMMLFVSARGTALESRLEREEIYVGEKTW